MNKNELRIRAKKIISDKTYFEGGTAMYDIIRGICIIRGEPVRVTKGASSAQVVFLKSEFGRKNDIFMVVLGSEEKSSPEGYKVGIISTVRETDDPEAEIQPIIEKLGDVVRCFIDVKPVNRAQDTENIFTKGVDESPHFDLKACMQKLQIYA